MHDKILQLVKQALQEAREAGELRLDDFPEISFEIPKRADQGDLATPLAMHLAPREKLPPRQIAETVIRRLAKAPSLIGKVEVAGPGYINFHLRKDYWYEVLRVIHRQGEAYGRSDEGRAERVQVEFVSANPTGPLHVGHGRNGAVGDVLANLLTATGFQVQREYYVNDVGLQMETLGRSVMMRCQAVMDGQSGDLGELPEGHYQGAYIEKISRKLVREQPDQVRENLERREIVFFAAVASAGLLKQIRQDLEHFGVSFDAWVHEHSLHDEERLERLLRALEKAGCLYLEEGAQWLRTEKFGDEKDRVIRRSNGQFTYFASDIAYHQQKYERGFHRLIDVWGADHHGYIPRMKAAMEMLGQKPQTLQVLVIQLVKLLRSGKPVTMSTRAGEFVTLREVLDEVGTDAARFIFLMRRCDTPLDFDLDLAKEQSSENPVYYVQYAYARICSVEENAGEQEIDCKDISTVNFHALDRPEEIALIKQLSLFPALVQICARMLEPHRLTFYLQDLAGLFHNYYRHHRILGENLEISRARLALILAVRTILANALGLLGVCAPRKM